MELFIFKERKIEPEMLDRAPPDVARRNLADLVRINQYFGGHSVLRELLAQASIPATPCSVLDVGAASGDSARVICETYSQARVYSLDLHEQNLHAAPQPKMIGDAFALPLASASVDFVLSALFLHHFTNSDIVKLLREFDRVARRGVLISDLERNLWSYLFVGYSGLLFRWGEITTRDGKISVRAGFRKPELETLAKQAGLSNARVREHRPAFRLTLCALKG